MTEQERKPIQPEELTTRPNPSRLEGRKLFFMAEDNRDQEPQQRPSETPGKQEVSIGPESSPQRPSSAINPDQQRQLANVQVERGEILKKLEELQGLAMVPEFGEDEEVQKKAQQAYDLELAKLTLNQRKEYEILAGTRSMTYLDSCFSSLGIAIGEQTEILSALAEGFKRGSKEVSEDELPAKKLQSILSLVKEAHTIEEIKTLLTEDIAGGEMGKDKTRFDTLHKYLFFAAKGKLRQQSEEQFSVLREKISTAITFLDSVARGELDEGDLDNFKSSLEDVIEGFKIGDKEVSGLAKIYKDKNAIEEDIMPKCLEDLGRLIMYTEVDEFKTGGAYELIDINGNFKQRNFLAWIRSRALYQHDFNPDSEIDLFSNINLFKTYRTITFSEMLSDPRYFMEETERITRVDEVKDQGQETGKMRAEKEIDYARNTKYEKLRDHVMYEVWLFMMSHNMDAKYRHVSGQEQEIPKIIAELYYNNVFTKDKNRLLRILQLPSINEEELDDVAQKEDSKDRKQGSVGKMIHRMLMAYYYLSEVSASEDQLGGKENMLEKILGKNGTVDFYKSIISGLEKDINVDRSKEIDILETETIDEYIKRLKNITASLLFRKYDYGNKKDEDGKFSEYDQNNMYKQLERLNIFNAVEKETFIFDLVRGAIRDAVYKTILGDTVKDLEGKEHIDKDSILSVNKRYAENWAFSMVYWLGIGAKNDISAISFDAFNKLLHTKKYRLRQVGPDVGGRGKWGDTWSLFYSDAIALDPLTALKVSVSRKVKDRSGNEVTVYKEIPLIEALQGEEGDEFKYSGNSGGDIEQFEFKTNAQRQYAVNHIMNASALYDFIMNKHGMNMHEILRLTDFKYVVDPKKADEVIWNGLYKFLRYSYDLPGFDYKKEVRGWWYDSEGKLHYGTRTIEQSLFCKQILDEFKMSKRFDEKTKNNRARDVFAYLLAKELRYHRRFLSVEHQLKYDVAQVMAIQDYFLTRPISVKETPGGDEKIKDTFFNRSEMRVIAKASKTTLARMFSQELSKGLSISTISSLIELLKYFFKGAIKF